MSKILLKFMLSCTLFVVYFHYASSNIYISRLIPSPSSLAKCTSKCEETFSVFTNKVAKSEICSRGCRFYGIAEVVEPTKDIELNTSKDSCHNCCFDSYKENTDEAACNMGCDMMEKHLRQITGEDAEVSYLLGDSGPPTIQPGELMEQDDVLTDPGLRKQFIMNLMNDNKIPEVQVKTLPVNGIEPMSWRREFWPNCVERPEALPRCLLTSFVVFLIVLGLWLTFRSEEKVLRPISPPVFDFEKAPPLPEKYSLIDNVKV